MWFLIFIIALVLFFYFTGIKPIKYWKDFDIPCVKPWPYFGNLTEVIFRKRAVPYVIDHIYHAFPEKRYCGFYGLFGRPSLLIRDPELLKMITVKEFETFSQHRPFLSEDEDPLGSKNLFSMRGGEAWHNMRMTLSPSFTGSKMRMMFELMKVCSKQFSDYFPKQNGTITVELKDAFTRFANDVIATTAFGVTCNSSENRNNEFYEMGKKIASFSGFRGFCFLFNAISPTILKMMNFRPFNLEASNFFTRIIKETIKLREEKGIVRPDMIHLLMEVRKGRLKPEDQNSKLIDTGFATAQEFGTDDTKKRQKPEITDEDIVAQSLIFFFAGFDSVSTMMCYACYELALNPNIQETLRIEIEEALSKTQGNLTFENLMGLKYLDRVVTETLRKWPPFTVNDRQSTRSFTIEPEVPEEKPLYIPKGSVCLFPTYSIQRDPKYFPDPEKFDPERFNDENKVNINPFAYLPFGSGPRNCIGSRFALLEGKLIIAEVISKFEIVPVEKTQIPIQISKRNFNIIPDEGLWLGLKPRNSK